MNEGLCLFCYYRVMTVLAWLVLIKYPESAQFEATPQYYNTGTNCFSFSSHVRWWEWCWLWWASAWPGGSDRREASPPYAPLGSPEGGRRERGGASLSEWGAAWPCKETIQDAGGSPAGRADPHSAAGSSAGQSSHTTAAPWSSSAPSAHWEQILLFINNVFMNSIIFC